jgi:hypothetical protein
VMTRLVAHVAILVAGVVARGVLASQLVRSNLAARLLHGRAADEVAQNTDAFAVPCHQELVFQDLYAKPLSRYCAIGTQRWTPRIPYQAGMLRKQESPFATLMLGATYCGADNEDALGRTMRVKRRR